MKKFAGLCLCAFVAVNVMSYAGCAGPTPVGEEAKKAPKHKVEKRGAGFEPGKDVDPSKRSKK